MKVDPVKSTAKVDWASLNNRLFSEYRVISAEVERLASSDSADLKRAQTALNNELWEIVIANLGLVIAAAKPFNRPGSKVTLDDMKSAGMEALAKKIPEFDPEKGSFASFVYFPIRTAIHEQVRLADFPHLATSLFYERVRVREAQRELQADNPLRKPTHEEIATKAKVLLEHVTRILATPVKELDAPLGEEGQTFGEMLASDSDDSDLDFVISDLPSRAEPDIETATRRLGLDVPPEKRLEAISKVLGIPKQKVAEIEEEARSKLVHSALQKRATMRAKLSQEDLNPNTE
jgi:RNA polymerase sigma factor (sigma-70 family)